MPSLECLLTAREKETLPSKAVRGVAVCSVLGVCSVSLIDPCLVLAEATRLVVEILPSVMEEGVAHSTIDVDDLMSEVVAAIEEVVLRTCPEIKVGEEHGRLPRNFLRAIVESVTRTVPMWKYESDRFTAKRLYVLLNTEGFCDDKVQYFQVQGNRFLSSKFFNHLSIVVVSIIRKVDVNLNILPGVSTEAVRIGAMSLYAFFRSIGPALMCGGNQYDVSHPKDVMKKVWEHPRIVNGVVISDPSSLFSFKPYYQKLASYLS